MERKAHRKIIPAYVSKQAQTIHVSQYKPYMQKNIKKIPLVRRTTLLAEKGSEER